ncbi:hypothetical protein FGB62_138g020 [Gracilaria domingensis]|nr:hypothetical protein FGB62_138g020 [Gracilaria domingensis]
MRNQGDCVSDGDAGGGVGCASKNIVPQNAVVRAVWIGRVDAAVQRKTLVRYGLRADARGWQQKERGLNAHGGKRDGVREWQQHVKRERKQRGAECVAAHLVLGLRFDAGRAATGTVGTYLGACAAERGRPSSSVQGAGAYERPRSHVRRAHWANVVPMAVSSFHNWDYPKGRTDLEPIAWNS